MKFVLKENRSSWIGIGIPRIYYLLVWFPCFLWLCLLLKETSCLQTEQSCVRPHQVKSVEEKKVFLVEKKIKVDTKLANFPCKHLFEHVMALRGPSKGSRRSLNGPLTVPQRALKDLFEQAMAFEGSSKFPHRALKDLFKHTMAFEGYLQWWTSSSPARSPGPSSWSSPSRPCPQSSSSCRSSSQLGRHFLRCS